MTGVDPYDAVSDAVEFLSSDPSDAQVLNILERNLEHFIAADLNHRLVPFAARLAEIDYSERPLAALPAAVAMCAVDRTRGRRVLRMAREALEAADDARGWGYACFLEGLEDLGEGQLERSERWWVQAAALLGHDSGVVGFTDAHLALVAYQRGDLRRAVRLGELALFGATRRNDHRVEAIAAVYLAFFLYWVGDFARAGHAVRQARAASARIAEPSNRYEMPLVCAIDAALCATGGATAAAEDRFDEALAEAERMHNEWYRAITLSARALLTAAAEPLRAVADATDALEYFDRVGERWWIAWATNSLAVAHLAAGEHHAGLAACAETLAVDTVSPLERARALCTRAELLERTGEVAGATAAITEAIACFDQAGAHYWAARAEVIAAAIDRSRSEFHVRSARRRSPTDPPSSAWALMLRGRGRLRIDLLGPPSVTIDSRSVRFTTRAELEAVALLTIAGDGGLGVDELAEALWPDAEWSRVAHRVDNLVSSVRRNLLPTTRLTRTGGRVHLRVESGESDYLDSVAVLRNVSSEPPIDPAAATAARTALASLSSPLMGGPVARWVVSEQARIDAWCASAVARLAH